MKASEMLGKSILIIGSPASGKTFLSDKMKNMGFNIIHTDDYIQYGFADSLYKLLENIDGKDLKNTAIEGVLGYRLLRKGFELKSYKPDVIIELNPPIDMIIDRYKASRGEDKINHVKSMIKANETVLNQYKRMEKEQPKWITIADSGVLFT